MNKSFVTVMVRSLVTGAVLITLLITTMLPGWATRALSAADDVSSAGNALAREISAGPSAAPPLARAEAAAPEPVVPLNTLILADDDTLDTVARTVAQAGGTVYVRYGDALFAGVETLGSAELIAAGARAAYRGPVPTTALVRLAGGALTAARVWNAITAPDDAPADAVPLQSTARTAAVMSPEPPAPARTTATYAPTPEQTSAYMVGDVAVKVLFVESASGPETWTTAEVDKVKTEVT